MSRTIANLGLAVIGIVAAVLSFAALRDLAILCGFGDHLSTLYPINIDAAALASSVIWLSGHSTALARRMTLILLALSVGLNAVFHGLTAYHLAPAWPLVVLVGGIPAAVLGAVAHLCIQEWKAEIEFRGGLTVEDLEAAEEAAGVPILATRDIPTVLYRARNAEDELLYVGITSVPLSIRLARHRREKPWWADEVVRVDIENYPRRKDALVVENAAIANENPKYNRARGVLSDPVSVLEATPVTVPTADEADALAKARALVAGGGGRGTLMRELDLTDHQARVLLEKVRQPVTTATTTNGASRR